MLRALDAAEIRRWAAACVQALDAHREDIDRINVYPVPDGDTGTNLLHTMRAALDALLRSADGEPAGAGTALAILASGAVSGARGNSGVIVSQLLRGIADALRDESELTGPGLAAALSSGAEQAVRAVAEPMPGTMLTVLEEAAAGARLAGGQAELGEVVTAAVETATMALEHTPFQLAVLAEAGVVDAGGRGVVVLLDALHSVVTERPAALVAAAKARTERAAPPRTASAGTPRFAAEEPGGHPLVALREAGSDVFGYEVMYLLDAVHPPHWRTDGTGPDGDAEVVEWLRDTLHGLGDCVSVVGDGSGLWTVHVHCNDVGAAIEAGVQVGRPRRIRVARFADAHPPEPSRFVEQRAVVVAARTPALAELLSGEGAVVCLFEGQGALAPDAYQRLLRVITSTAAAHVTVLPAESALTEAADEAAIRAVAAGQDVVVVPCASPVQTLAAVAVHDPRRRAGDDVVAMAEAAAATRWGEIVVAEQDAITWIGPCRAGDVLGFADGEVVLIETGPATADTLDRAALGVAERMLAVGGELVTALLGAHAPAELPVELADYLRREHPEADLAVYPGAPPGTVLAFGVE